MIILLKKTILKHFLKRKVTVQIRNTNTHKAIRNHKHVGHIELSIIKNYNRNHNEINMTSMNCFKHCDSDYVITNKINKLLQNLQSLLLGGLAWYPQQAKGFCCSPVGALDAVIVSRDLWLSGAEWVWLPLAGGVEHTKAVLATQGI